MNNADTFSKVDWHEKLITVIANWKKKDENQTVTVNAVFLFCSHAPFMTVQKLTMKN